MRIEENLVLAAEELEAEVQNEALRELFAEREPEPEVVEIDDDDEDMSEAYDEEEEDESEVEEEEKDVSGAAMFIDMEAEENDGLEVVPAEISPIVNGFIVIGTRVEDEDGLQHPLPHTLEHLTFLGSEDYPFNGALDRAANKCFASGMNAWTR
ncbi:unnamed protein product, partial [Orchesella dallaii]